MSKKDDVNSLYTYSIILQKIIFILFYVNLFFAIFPFFYTYIGKNICIEVQILSSILYVIISTYDDCYCWFDAESARRKNSIENAFNIDITNLKTDGYYNNNIQPSIIKYSINTFESVYFSRNISKKMLMPKLLRCIFSIIIFILALLELKQKEFILVIVQTIFSAYFIIDTLNLFIYNHKLDKLYENFYREFITIGIDKDAQHYILMADSIEYEAIKAHYKVRLSSRIFNKINSDLSKEWKEIYKKCKICSLQKRIY